MKNKIKLITISILLFFLILSISYLSESIDNNSSSNKTLLKNNEKILIDKYPNFNSKLPLIIIETEEKNISINNHKETYINKSRGVLKEINQKNNNLKRNYNSISYTTIKLRGNSSLFYDKKQYKLEIFKTKEYKDKLSVPLLDLKKEIDWVLHGPFLDKSFIRNHLVYQISQNLFDYVPNSKLCEVFINNDYKGIYVLIESIKEGDNRIDLYDFSLLNGNTPYILQRELKGSELNEIDTYGTKNGYTSHQLSIRYPTSDDLLNKQRKWILNDINKFEKALYSKQFKNPVLGYKKYIDIDSFINYFIINEFSMNIDACCFSTYIYKDLNGKLKLTLWDYNNAFNNFVKPLDYNKFYMINKNWYNRLLQDEYFTDKLIDRYYKLRKTTLSEKNLYKLIDKYHNQLKNAAIRNNDKWNKTLKVDPQPNVIRNPKNFDQAINSLKTSIHKRGKFLDKNFKDLNKYIENKGD
ncbi:MAG: CotH kinase family protein [Bacillota bacterium]